jgi:transposase-like protein
MSVLTDLRNRGVADVFFLVCDGLKGLPEVVENIWPAATVQTCIIHLIRNTFRLTSRVDHDAVKRDLKPSTRRRPGLPPRRRWTPSRRTGAANIGP